MCYLVKRKIADASSMTYGLITVAFSLSRRELCPVVTTNSPSVSPRVISTMSSEERPGLTCLSLHTPSLTAKTYQGDHKGEEGGQLVPFCKESKERTHPYLRCVNISMHCGGRKRPTPSRLKILISRSPSSKLIITWFALWAEQ